VESCVSAPQGGGAWGRSDIWAVLLLVGLTAVIYVGSAGFTPLLNDTDSLYAEVAREMNARADWITPYANGLRYFEKPPVFYWMMSLSFGLFGVANEFTARLPTALAVVALVVATFVVGRELFGRRAGLFAGLALASSAGTFLFTRIVLPDAPLTLTITLFFYAFIRWQRTGHKTAPLLWMYALAAVAVLVKGFIGIVFPGAGVLAALAATRRLGDLRHLISARGIALLLAICGPWLALMEVRNPGFLWYYVVNEHILRFLGTREPMDYIEVPLLAFWGLHLVWLFPWSIYLATLARPAEFRAALAKYGDALVVPLAWAGAVVLFFSLSSSRLEYYTMPALPALAVLAGMRCAACWERGPSRAGVVLATIGFAVGGALLMAAAIDPHWLAMELAAVDTDPERLSYFGHIFDLSGGLLQTLRSPMLAAGIGLGVLLPLHHWLRPAMAKAALLVAGMLVLFAAATSAFSTFAPRLSSAALAKEINRRWEQPATIIADGDFEESSSVAFYTQRPLLLHEGHSVNLDYGAGYPDAPHWRLGSRELDQLWSRTTQRVFLLASPEREMQLAHVIGGPLFILARQRNQLLLSNLPDGFPPADRLAASLALGRPD
jgi:4-amino-4-deoxy-L-arabinose transferase-like glycosyltransferase